MALLGWFGQGAPRPATRVSPHGTQRLGQESSIARALTLAAQVFPEFAARSGDGCGSPPFDQGQRCPWRTQGAKSLFLKISAWQRSHSLHAVWRRHAPCGGVKPGQLAKSVGMGDLAIFRCALCARAHSQRAQKRNRSISESQTGSRSARVIAIGQPAQGQDPLPW
jgi:hypothetical protein